MATPLTSILDAHPEIVKKNNVTVTRFGALVDELQKMGARHGKRDKELVQSAHDTFAKLCDGAHCGDMAKANARHSKADMELIKQGHDAAVKLGAACPSPTMQKE
jgi:hypothetical protein